MLSKVKAKIKEFKLAYLEEANQLNKKSYVGEHSVPICADITKFDF